MIGILSDSHDHIEHLQKAVALFAEKKVELVIHGGDACSPFVWPFFRDLKVSVYAVLGNNAGDAVRGPIVAKKHGVDLRLDPFFQSFAHGGRKFAVFHGDPFEVVEALAKSQTYDVVVYGHDHVPAIRSEGKTLLINPGSLVSKVSSKLSVFSAKSNPGPSVALYDPVRHQAEMVFL